MSKLPNEVPDSELRHFAIACEPSFVSPRGTVTVEIHESAPPASAIGSVYVLEITDGENVINLLRSSPIEQSAPYRQKISISVDESLPPGYYIVAVGPEYSDTRALKSFTVTTPEFEFSLHKLMIALECHRQGLEYCSRSLLTEAIPPLRRAAEIFSQLVPSEFAVATWRDLAACFLTAGDLENCRLACRMALWASLAAACENVRELSFASLTAAGVGSGIPPSPDLVSSAFAPSLHDVFDVCDRMSTAKPAVDSVLLNALPTSRDRSELLRRVFVLLTSLGHREDAFQMLLHRYLSAPDVAAAAYLCLVRLDTLYAVSALPEFSETAARADRFTEFRNVLTNAVQLLDLPVLYAYLPYVTPNISVQARDAAIRAILDARPIEAVIVGDRWHVFDAGKRGAAVATIPNCDPWSTFLLPYFAAASFTEARAAVEDVA